MPGFHTLKQEGYPLTATEVAVIDSIAALGDPGADRIMFWDESANAFAWLTVGDGVDITLTTLTGTGANKALSNLVGVAINTSLISDTDSTDDLGSSDKYWANTYTDKIYLNGTATLDGAVAGAIGITGNQEIIGSTYIKWLDATRTTTYAYLQSNVTETTISAVNTPLSIKYGALGSDIGASLDTAGNWIFNYAAGDCDFTINKQTAGAAYTYDAGADTSTFGSAIIGLSSLTLGTVGTATGSVVLKGTTSGVVTLKTADAAGTYTLTLPTDDGGVGQFLQTDGSGVLTWADGGAAGASTALDNLASVAINTSLISDTDNTDDLGSADKAWKDIYSRTLKLDGATSGTVTIDVAAEAGTWTLTLPTTDGTNGQYLQTDGDGNTTWATVSGTGASTALDNLASVAINTSLISDTDNTDDLGSSDKEWKDLYIDGTAYIDNIEIASGETITGDGTDMTIGSGGAINLTATTDVVIPANVGITFGTGEKIEGDDTDLTITSGAKINLTATSDVIVPVNIGIIFGDGAEKIESNNTDLTINSGADINLTATADVNIPANVGIVFGDDGEKIEGDGTNLTIASSGTLNLNSTGAITASYQGIADNAVVTIDDADATESDFAKFTANGLEGRSYSETLSDISGAKNDLSNLSSVAVNESIISDTDNTDDLGSADKSWKDVYARTIKLDGSTSGTVTIDAAAEAGTWSLTLPVNDGDANQVLTTDGSGNTSWTTPSGGGSCILGIYQNAEVSYTLLDDAIYYSPGDSSTTISSSYGLIMPKAGTLKNLYVKAASNTLNNTCNVYIRKNGVSTTLTVAITAGSTSVVSDTEHMPTFNAGDLIAIQFYSPSSTSGSLKYFSASFEVE